MQSVETTFTVLHVVDITVTTNEKTRQKAGLTNKSKTTGAIRWAETAYPSGAPVTRSFVLCVMAVDSCFFLLTFWCCRINTLCEHCRETWHVFPLAAKRTRKVHQRLAFLPRWIYNYLFNQCLSQLKLCVRIPVRWSVLDITLCDEVCGIIMPLLCIHIYSEDKI
jgi:hypothetical protein